MNKRDIELDNKRLREKIHEGIILAIGKLLHGPNFQPPPLNNPPGKKFNSLEEAIEYGRNAKEDSA